MRIDGILQPGTDCITLPARELFTSFVELYCTAYHPLSTAQGATKRLREKDFMKPLRFGSPVYSKEELIEVWRRISVCRAGISNAVIDNQAAYLFGWL